MNITTFSLSASISDWTPDSEGGYDLWWVINRSFIVDGVEMALSTGTRRRAGDVWSRAHDGTSTWSYVAYDPSEGGSLASGHGIASADVAKAMCFDAICEHLCADPSRK